jgi:parallel beta-helix repeat protein
VLVEDCEVVGASDAGIYVGQSRDIIVRNNVVHGNVAGIEVENSTNADVYDNRAYDNTAGVLVFNLPNLPVRDGRRCLVRSNTIENNNRANFAPRGSIVARCPRARGCW